MAIEGFGETIGIYLIGGTIDKDYNELDGSLGFESGTHIEEMLQDARMTGSFKVGQLMLKDSLDMTEADRQIVVEALRNSSTRKNVLLHGTDTMPETARAINEAGLTGQTNVLFGAMRPFALSRSDAMFNFGSAITAVRILEPGVWVTMDGQIFPGETVSKNTSIGRFEHRTLDQKRSF